MSWTLSEPNPRYFDEGSDYSEYRPSNLIRQALQKLGIHEEESRHFHHLEGISVK